MDNHNKTDAYYNDRETEETLNGLFLDAKTALDEFNRIAREWNATHDDKINEQLIVPRLHTTV